MREWISVLLVIVLVGGCISTPTDEATDTTPTTQPSKITTPTTWPAKTTTTRTTTTTLTSTTLSAETLLVTDCEDGFESWRAYDGGLNVTKNNQKYGSPTGGCNLQSPQGHPGLFAYNDGTTYDISGKPTLCFWMHTQDAENMREVDQGRWFLLDVSGRKRESRDLRDITDGTKTYCYDTSDYGYSDPEFDESSVREVRFRWSTTGGDVHTILDDIQFIGPQAGQTQTTTTTPTLETTTTMATTITLVSSTTMATTITLVSATTMATTTTLVNATNISTTPTEATKTKEIIEVGGGTYTTSKGYKFMLHHFGYKESPGETDQIDYVIVDVVRPDDKKIKLNTGPGQIDFIGDLRIKFINATEKTINLEVT